MPRPRKPGERGSTGRLLPEKLGPTPQQQARIHMLVGDADPALASTPCRVLFARGLISADGLRLLEQYQAAKKYLYGSYGPAMSSRLSDMAKEGCEEGEVAPAKRSVVDFYYDANTLQWRTTDEGRDISAQRLVGVFALALNYVSPGSASTFDRFVVEDVFPHWLTEHPLREVGELRFIMWVLDRAAWILKIPARPTVRSPITRPLDERPSQSISNANAVHGGEALIDDLYKKSVH